ncbi:D-ribose ABC transporter substrate-binding protein [Miniphocaeibacter halophilus]|uniref:D-ribose ABC transporter substrate-binding protein n=1 Tax=Miniphocaeibacter halophilus TaxID=2931922 RepID=A0AC61MRY4_9FIRM|nr:D-ribose ABC transporter substrate-binding protein [Miniphocaeibacter halophilus]QQK07083.1 D-ribose ABC transporter substrate-binding protein [Miniphocaeibacter halophilus]
MKKTKLLSLSLIMVLVLGVLAGCSVDGEKKEEADGTNAVSEGTGTIGLSVSTLNNPFFVTLADGAKAAAKDAEKELIVVDAGDDSAKQASDIEDLISKKVSVLIVNPVDSDAVAPAVQQAKDAGIKVIAVDRMVNGVDIESTIASDNVAGAKMATEYLLEEIGESAKVAELEGVPGASATIDRGEGFHEIADKSLEVVSKQTANFNRAEGLSVMENILQSNPDITGVFAHNDEMALGAIEAIKSSGKDIKVVGFDATDDAKTAVESGDLLATVEQQPELMGKKAIEIAIKLLNGETVEKDIPVEVKLVTK